MKELSLILFITTLVGCASLSRPNDAENVIEYSMARHGMLLDELIPFAKQTGVYESERYTLYYDAITDNDWDYEYAAYCKKQGGEVVSEGKYYSPRNCILKNDVLFSWLSGINQNGFIETMHKSKIKTYGKYFVVLMPKEPQLDKTFVEEKLISHYQWLSNNR
ncbi:hypothetical protein P0F40_003376 [Vibrio metschnikovii]|uniref:Lipoprotein n=3 Tax=Unclassified Bacteria TaxID=49928 RepID=A0AAU6UK16_UNCXX|nr:hypothetical protein [Vibrio metschnikovii]EKO3622502.1 hypothetical protein [Vibrio metschnikovii]EKO3625779.1 hypothetical protein [Vibrio metschnikovii]EKO3643157.1 hypothetical protein [Vibrio metschnikovii]EKO3667539.1 hypothetical protein [Vibrio metschnikovii]